MSDFQIVAVRGSLDESVHHVSAVVVDGDGRMLAHVGDPEQLTYWRSASKPFQLFPLVADGGIERFGLDGEMLALACGSHNAEAAHRAAGMRWLAAVGLRESDLSCGGHPSLWSGQAEQMIRDGVVPTALWSNCSGKHAAMLALARLNGWPTEGYQTVGHPVQERVAAAIARWTGVPTERLVWGVDGCTAAAVALPLSAMARGYAALGVAGDPPLALVREAMMAHPKMIAGTARLETTLMQSWPGRVIAKIGAQGVFSAALPTLGVGLALKVHDGDMRVSERALLALLQQLVTRLDPAGEWPMLPVARWIAPEIRNTRHAVTGSYQSRGMLRFT